MNPVDTSQSSQPEEFVRDRLVELAGRLATGGRTVSGLKRLTGGASLQTWAFDVQGTQGVSRLILRRRGAGDDADGFETSLPLSIEAKLLQAAHSAGVPVAALIRDCPEADGLGEAYIVERVEGETLGRRIAAAEGFSQARANLTTQCGQTLARIHAIDPQGVPELPVLGPRAIVENFEAIYRKSSAPRPVLEAALRWMDERMPREVPMALVHGDFRNGNLMVDPQKGLAAVLDWELAHLGDPAEDIGWLCVNAWRFGVTDKAVGGFGDLETLLASYNAAGGPPVDPERIRFWQMAGTFKWAVITMMMFQTYATGGGSIERAVIGRRLSECEVDLLALMENGQ